MMPHGASQARGRQMAMLGLLRHEYATSPERAVLIDQSRQQGDELDDWQKANLLEIAHDHLRATALKPDLVERLILAANETEFAWRHARAENDFSVVAPELDNLLSLTREKAAMLGDVLQLDCYDALLDGYESGIRCADFVDHFETLSRELPPLLDAALCRQAENTPPIPFEGPFPIARQEALNRELVRRLGFDFDHGRLDVSQHPFSGGEPDDVRMTTRYDEHEFIQALMACVHETGHSLYTLGLPVRWRDQPVGEARGMIMHESQSLCLEMQLARSPAFLSFLAPFVAGFLGGGGPVWSEDHLCRHVHRVERGLIRVHADEISYPLHVIMRFGLERRLVEGRLAVRDLPEAWRSEMDRMIGIVPDGDLDGCLQDIHWYSGAFGYFPTYTLGAMAAAQLFAAAVQCYPEIFDEARDGRADSLTKWMRHHVHEKGSRYSTQTILRDTTGQPLGVDAFLTHLRRRYL